MKLKNDLSGKRFWNIRVIKRAEDYVSPNGKHITKWLCICDCGKTFEAIGSNIVKGSHKSCGCTRFQKTHGMTNSRLYRIWNDMVTRCEYTSHKSYHRYGGRGIKVCDEWRHDPSTFISWALENGYSDHLSIDRIDNDGNYEPSNCRWVTQREQTNNNSRNRLIEYNGEIKTVSEWAEEKHLNYSTLLHRIERGWELERAFNENVHSKSRNELRASP